MYGQNEKSQFEILYSDLDIGLECEEAAAEELNECYLGCADDPSCIRVCIRDYDYQFYNCPCRAGCRDGCPCPVYDCPDRPTTSTLV